MQRQWPEAGTGEREGKRAVRSRNPAPRVRVHTQPGHLTWEWKHQLRGSVYPLLIAAFYKLAQVPRILKASVP